MKPALSAEEWALKDVDLEDPVKGATLSAYVDGRFVYVGRYDMEQVTRPHTLAALCLHGQAFGFWPELPRTLRIAAEKLRVLTDSPDDWVNLEEAADRIEALLPPKDGE
jgi:hypothetical protein